MAGLCPYCGSDLTRGGIEWNVQTGVLRTPEGSVRLSKSRARLFDLVWKHNGALTLNQIAERFYVGEDGGPLDARNVLGSIAYYIRQLVEPLGVTIRADSSSRDAHWRVLPLRKEAA